MRELSLREKILIGLMLVLILVLGGGLGLRYLAGGDVQWTSEIEKRERWLQKTMQAVQELQQLQTQSQPPVMKGSLSSFIENGARQFNLQDRLQLNALTTLVPPGLDGLQVKLDQINLDEFHNILYLLENTQPVLLIEQLELSVIPGSNLLRVSFRIYKQNRT